MVRTLGDELVESMPSSEKRFANKQADIAAQIAEILDKKGWTQRDLADAANLQESYVSRILRGWWNPTLKTICAIEEALGENIIIVPAYYALEMREKRWAASNHGVENIAIYQARAMPDASRTVRAEQTFNPLGALLLSHASQGRISDWHIHMPGVSNGRVYSHGEA